MRVVVFGAGGRTGRLVIEELLRGGHEAVAFVRRTPGPLPERAEVVIGDATDAGAVSDALAGAAAAVVCLGPDALGDATACAEGTRNVLAAARAHKIKRVAAVTGAMIGHPPEELGLVLRLLRARFRAANEAHARAREEQEHLLEEAGLREMHVWVVRPTRLVEGPRGRYVLTRAGVVPSLAASRRSDVARALAAAVTNGSEAGPGGAALLSEGHVDAPIVGAFVLATAAAEALGLAASGLLLGLARGRGAVEALGAALISAAIEGALVGLAQGPLVETVFPRLRLGRWVAGTVLGAAIAWALGMLPTLLAQRAEVPASSAVARLAFAAGLGLLTGPVLAAFQAPELARSGGRRWRWMGATALAWCLGMPLVFQAARAAFGGGSAARAVAWLLAAGACVGLVQATLGLRASRRRSAPRSAG